MKINFSLLFFFLATAVTSSAYNLEPETDDLTAFDEQRYLRKKGGSFFVVFFGGDGISPFITIGIILLCCCMSIASIASRQNDETKLLEAADDAIVNGLNEAAGNEAMRLKQVAEDGTITSGVVAEVVQAVDAEPAVESKMVEEPNDSKV